MTQSGHAPNRPLRIYKFSPRQLWPDFRARKRLLVKTRTRLFAGPRCSGGTEYLPNPAGELGAGHRFLDHLDAGIETALMHYGVARISGHEQHLHVGVQNLELVGELAPVHSGQNDVGQQQIEFSLLDQRERLLGIVGLLNFVVKLAQRIDNIMSHVIVVLDDKNAFAGGALDDRRLRAFDFVPGRLIADQPRQIDFDRRALAEFAVDLYVTARLLDEAIDLAQAESGSLAGWFCGEERLECSL